MSPIEGSRRWIIIWAYYVSAHLSPQVFRLCWSRGYVCMTTRPEVLDVFHKAKQKHADLRWWVGGVHQIVIWSGTARLGKQNRASGAN